MDNLMITREDAHRAVAAGGKLIDVRTAGEFAGGAAPGAVNVPVQVIAAEIHNHAEPEDTVVLYCKSGMRSDLAAKILRGLGYSKAFNLGTLGDW
jgi:phage shock protein E